MSIESVISSYHLTLFCPLFLLPSIFSSIRVFSKSQFFTSGGQSIGASASESVLPMNIQDWFPLGWTGLTPCSPRDSEGSFPIPQFHSSKASISQHSAFLMVQLSHPYMTTGKTRVLPRWTFVGKVISLLFNMLSRLVIVFLPRSKWLLLSRLQSPYAVILEPLEIKSLTVSIFTSSVGHEVVGPDAMIFVFWMPSFKPTFSLSCFTFIKFFYAFCHKGGVICVSDVIDISPDNLDSSLCFIQPGISHEALCI